jgi:hypothetical protein
MAPSQVDTVIEALGQFDAAAHPDCVGPLSELFEGFRQLDERERAVPAMLHLLERFPAADFGSPGPLVHELEDIVGYRASLRESLHRQPTKLTVWMINRILNSRLVPAERALWLSELRQALEHPNTSADARELARGFLDRQVSAT